MNTPRPRHWITAALPLFFAFPSGAAERVMAEPSSAARAAEASSRMDHWRKQRFGLFIHWGPYSVLGGSYGGKVYPGNTEWIMRTAAISRADYRKVAQEFDPSGFKAEELVEFAGKCGFRYIILTAKHYDGFALFDSQVSDFDSVDVSPSKRDLVGEFSKACRAAGMPLGFSYALDRDWYHPGGNTLGKAWDPTQAGSRDAYLRQVALPQIRELTSRYGPVFALHANAGPGIPEWLAPGFEQAVDSRTIMPWRFSGGGDYIYTDGLVLGHTHGAMDWEKCTTLGDSWGYRKGGVNWGSSTAIIRELVTTVSMGGNYLLNAGLDGGGRIPEGVGRILEETGAWLAKYGEAIYGTSKSPYVSHSWNGVATVKNEGEEGSTLFLHLFSDTSGKLKLGGLLPRPLSAEIISSGRQLGVSGIPGRWELDLGEGVETGGGIEVIRVRLPSPPELGPGPILADASGTYRLDFARGYFADARTALGRTPSSLELRLTGFRDDRETGGWELYSESPPSVRLRMVVESPEEVEGKRLLIRVNGGEVAEATVEKRGAVSPAGGWLVTSAPFRLPAGAATVTIAGEPDQETPVPLTSTRIDLIPAP